MATKLDVEPANFIRLDIFPGAVHPTGPEHPALGEEFRVIVTDNYFYAIMEATSGILFRIKEPLVSFSGSNKTGYTVETTEGIYHVRRADNCGCGSRLRGIFPFAGVPFESQL